MAGCRAVVLSFVLVTSLAPPALADALDSLAARALARTHTPGLALVVVHDGRTVACRGYGLADAERETPVTDHTAFALMSVSKLFTSSAILLLAEQGKLALADRLGDRLPSAPPAWAGVTLRQLLSHSSGIPDYTAVPGYADKVGREQSPMEVIAPVLDRPLAFTPGTRFAYSNTNYFLLGLVLERVSGMPLERFLRERLFAPLGMTATRVPDGRGFGAADRARGYVWSDRPDSTGAKPLRPDRDVSPTQNWAAGGIVSTARDLATWLAALDQSKPLPAAVLRDMETATTLADGTAAPYGLGNEVETDHGHRVSGHQGAGFGFDATVLRFPDDHLGVVVLANLRGGGTLPLAHEVAELYLPGLSDRSKGAIAGVDTAFTAALGRLLTNAAAGRVDDSLFTDAGRATVAVHMRQAGPRFLGRLGALQSLVPIERQPLAEGGAQLRYRSSFASGERLVWLVRVAADGRIEELSPRPE